MLTSKAMSRMVCLFIITLSLFLFVSLSQSIAADIFIDSGQSLSSSWDQQGLTLGDLDDDSDFDTFVTKDGDGTGIVKSDVAGISCGDGCADNYTNGTVVDPKASVEEDSVFMGRSGNCSDNAIVTMDDNKACTATFNPVEKPSFTLKKGYMLIRNDDEADNDDKLKNLLTDIE